MAGSISATSVSSFPVATVSLPSPNPPVVFQSIVGVPNQFVFTTKPSQEVAGAQTLATLTANAALTIAQDHATYWWGGGSSAIYWNYSDPDAQVKTLITSSVPVTLTAPSVSATTTETSSGLSSTFTTATGTTSQASSTTTSSSPKSSGKASSDGGLSKGAAAGVAVGCLIAGALIAGLLLLLFGRKWKGKNRRDGEAGAVAFLPREKQADINVQSVGSSSPVSGIVDSNLPQPLEDNAISGEINKIGSLIKNHVQSYYHSTRVSSGAADFEAFQTLGDNLPISAGTLGALLANPNTREVALRFYIARVVLSRSEFDSDPSISFLPPEIAACVRSMSSFNNSTQVRSAFLSKWRSVTAELLQGTYTRSPFSTADSRNGNISNALEELDSILQLYTDSRNDNSQRRRNLEEILKRVATFAFTLFSQPSSWKLDWQDEKGTEPGSLVVFPALVQLSDETGQLLRHPRPLSEAIIRRIDG